MAAMDLNPTGMRGGAHPQPTPAAPSRPPEARHAPPPASEIGVIERVAWFDLNGDGQISNQPAAFGGDGILIGDGNLDGRLSRGQESWYDARGRPVPPPPPGAGDVASPPPSVPPPRAEAARDAAAQAYREN